MASEIPVEPGGRAKEWHLKRRQLEDNWKAAAVAEKFRDLKKPGGQIAQIQLSDDASEHCAAAQTETGTRLRNVTAG